MNQRNGILILFGIALTETLSMIYIFYWSLIMTNGNWFSVNINAYNEFWLEFISLHLVIIAIFYIVIKTYKSDT